MRLAFAVLLIAVATVSAGAQVRERINKAWDERIEKIQSARIEAGCKAEAKKAYSAIHWKKRRLYVKTCIEQARR